VARRARRRPRARLRRGRVRGPDPPENRVVRYEIAIRRRSTFAEANATIAIADARVLVDDAPIYTIKGARVGLFTSLAADGRLATREVA
jgi:hypothetical protein